MSSRPPIDGSTPRPRPIEVAIVGNDALVAALPARPVQLSHAIHAMGYDFAVPVSWGEEIVAEHALRALNARRQAPAIFCACARMRERLLASGSELAAHIVAFVSPAVAAARYVRALQPTVRMRVTYIGSCDTGGDAAINATLAPDDLLRRLAERGISAVRQPAVFDSVIPPDRRRFYSLPGGCPAPTALASHAPEWHQVTVDDEAFATSLAELLLEGARAVIDLTPRLGCPCCAALGSAARDEREGHRPTLLGELEPPRSNAPVLDHDIDVAVDAPPLRRGRTLPAESVARDVLARERADNIEERAQSAAAPSTSRDAQIRDQQVRDRILREGASGERGVAALEPTQGAVTARPPAPTAAMSPSAAAPAGRPVEQGAVPAVAQESMTRDTTRRDERETPGVHRAAAHQHDVSGAESEREVPRMALPADVPPPRRIFGSLRLEGGHEGAARRRIAVTPPSVPVMPLRGGAAASLGSGSAAALRVPVAIPPHEPAEAPEITPAIGVRAIQAHPTPVEPPRAPVPILPIASSRTEGTTPPNESPVAKSAEPLKPARGRTVHDSFGVARRAARARSARLAAARLHRSPAEKSSAAGELQHVGQQRSPKDIETPLPTAVELSAPAPESVVQSSPAPLDIAAAALAADALVNASANEPVVHDIWVEAELQAKFADVIVRAKAEQGKASLDRPPADAALIGNAPLADELSRGVASPVAAGGVSTAAGTIEVGEHELRDVAHGAFTPTTGSESADVESDPATIVEEVTTEGTLAPTPTTPADPATMVAAAQVVLPSESDDPPNESASTDAAADVDVSASVVVGMPLSQTPFSFPVESPRPGPRVIRGRGRPARAPIVTHTDRKREESEKRRSDEPHPMVTLAITVVAVIAVLIALALVLQRNPLAP